MGDDADPIRLTMYAALRFLVRRALRLFFGHVRVDIRSAPPAGHTLLLACNHPNTFLDALVVAAHLPYRMRFMARGDAFRSPWAAKALKALLMIPVYRLDEGRMGLGRAEASLGKAHDALAHRWSVLVFSESSAKCPPELGPLGKGTARIASRAWQAELDMQVLPVWLGYGHFHRPYADISITTGEVLAKEALPAGPAPVFLHQFNATLRQRLLDAMRKSEGSKAGIPAGTARKKGLFRKTILFLPAALGLLLHVPWYLTLRGATQKLTRNTAYFDSVLFALLFLTYPLWLLVLACIGALLGLKAWAAMALVLAPLSALALRRFSME